MCWRGRTLLTPFDCEGLALASPTIESTDPSSFCMRVKKSEPPLHLVDEVGCAVARLGIPKSSPQIAGFSAYERSRVMT